VTAPGRVVVRGPNWLGDLVMTAPSVSAIRAHWPQAAIDLAVPAAFASIVPVLCPGVEALPLEGGRRGLRALRRHAARIAEGRYDLAVLFTHSFGTALTMRAAGVPERWGYRRDGRSLLLTRAVRPSRVRRATPQHADEYAALVEALGVPRPALSVHAEVSLEMRAEAHAVLRAEGWDGAAPLLVCAPGAAYGTAKQWPPESVGQVASEWLTHGGCVALVGADADRSAADAVRAATSAPVIDLTGRSSLLMLAAVLATATRVLANDSGAMHLAAALGTPVVAVFGPTREHVTAPLGPHTILTHEVWCRPCMLRECPLDHACMTRVTPARVLAALRDR